MTGPDEIPELPLEDPSLVDGRQVIPDDVSEAELELARDHVGEILFDASETADEDCLLCQIASRLELWQNLGFDDPLAPPATELGDLPVDADDLQEGELPLAELIDVDRRRGGRYEDVISDPECLRLRKASGEVDDPRPLVAFFYLLGRDLLALGALEQLIDNARKGGTDGHQFTNGYLARWAQDVCERLASPNPEGELLRRLGDVIRSIPAETTIDQLRDFLDLPDTFTPTERAILHALTEPKD